MPITVYMPALSPTMTEGSLAKWHVAAGDPVSAGDMLADIETDKATMEFEAVDDGIVGKLLVAEGDNNIPVNEPIAILLKDGEELPDTIEIASFPAAIGAPAETGTPVAAAPASPVPERSLPNREASGRIFASPLARRLAGEKGLDLAGISGTGPSGRIIKRDVESANQQPAVAMPAPPMPADGGAWQRIAASYAGREFAEVPLDNMRRIIASRLVEAKQTIPHFYLRREISLDELIRTRSVLNGALESRGLKISINDFIIKASAMALQLVPDANSVWAHDRMLKFASSDVAVAVAVDGGLFTPVIRDADQKSLPVLSQEMKSLAGKARARRLKPEEFTGGSFSISNLGMFGIENFDAVINPPHGSILAVGAGRRVPFETAAGSLGFKTSMSVTLSCDHRVIDGALGARFLGEIVNHLESPTLMLL